jgi:hypothetical protein
MSKTGNHQEGDLAGANLPTRPDGEKTTLPKDSWLYHQIRSDCLANAKKKKKKIESNSLWFILADPVHQKKNLQQSNPLYQSQFPVIRLDGICRNHHVILRK